MDIPTFTGQSGVDPAETLWDPALWAHLKEIAPVIAQSALIPPSLRGRTPDVILGLCMARMMNENPIMVLQSIQIISGRAGWSAQYLIARANASGRFRGPIDWRVEGPPENLAVTAYATVDATGHEVSFTASMEMARSEGWTKNPKYRTMPELMLRYRSATLLVRLYCPDVLMGMAEATEIEDVEAARGNSDGGQRPRAAAPVQPAIPPCQSCRKVVDGAEICPMCIGLRDETPSSPSPSPEVGVVADPTAKGDDKPAGKASGKFGGWESLEARDAFVADAKRIGFDYDRVKDLCDATGRRRPEDHDAKSRKALLKRLDEARGREKYAEVVARYEAALDFVSSMTHAERKAAAERAGLTKTAPKSLTLLELERVVAAAQESDADLPAEGGEDVDAYEASLPEPGSFEEEY